MTPVAFGIGGPKGMDPKIVAKLHDAFKKAIEDPAVIATLAKYDMVPNYKNTEDYKKFVVELTDLAPVDNNVYFSDGFAYAVATGDSDDQPVSDIVSSDYGVRTYLYTKFELVTIRSAG